MRGRRASAITSRPAAAVRSSIRPTIFRAASNYIAFADKDLGTPRRLLAGTAHFLVQATATGLLGIALVRFLHAAFGTTGGGWESAAAILAVSGIGGASAGFAMGLYLLVMLNRFGFHWNEAFSSLRLRDYKNLLRLRIDAQGGLHLHAIGIRQVPPARPRTCRGRI